jgi:4-hydroxybutyrate CoA-transferase
MSDFHSEYAKKRTTPGEAVSFIRDGGIVCTATSMAMPPALLSALSDRILNDELKNIVVKTGIDYVPNKLHQNLGLIQKKGSQVDSGFLTHLTRPASDRQEIGFMSIFLSRFADAVIDSGEEITLLSTASPMDRHGYFSFGTCNVWISDIITRAKKSRVILEVNENMPRTQGQNFVHISNVKALTENHVPLVEVKMPDPQEEDLKIAELIAEYVNDEDTIQLGIGALPDQVALRLKGKKNLGVHTELMTNAIVDLIEAGAVTCSKKNYFPGQIVSSFCMGTRKLYDFLDENPMVQMYPGSFTNNPEVAGRNDNFVSINATLGIDLLGQCASETIGSKPYSAIGGQADFVRAVRNSKNGRSFLSCYSTYTDNEGLKSRINPFHQNGTVISIGRHDVMYFATEYGVVKLDGINSWERAKRIISIAHPCFREQLTFDAKKSGLIY